MRKLPDSETEMVIQNRVKDAIDHLDITLPVGDAIKVRDAMEKLARTVIEEYKDRASY